MADFELEDDEFHLFFEDPKYNGLEVVIEGLSIEETLEFDRIRFTPTSGLDEGQKQTRAIAEFIGERLVSWNLTRKGVPVPCDAKGLMQQLKRRGFLDAVIDSYVQALRGVPAPLALGSSDTGESSSTTSPSEPTLSIPMEPLSESQ